ncbi:MaoC/PaaZ C-terminal domain-containing protein [Chloroflexota bacterium]
MIYFEDFEMGWTTTVGEYLVTKEEILEFGKRWDQAPYHIDEKAAESSIFGGLIAPGAFVMAIQTWLLHKQEDVTAALGRLDSNELRFPNPVRSDDRISLTMECIDKRESQSKSDRGIITQSIMLTNQNGETVLTLKDTILVARGPNSRLESVIIVKF